MSTSTIVAPALPVELTELCDGLAVPMTIADPSRRDTPLIYANAAFEGLSGWSKDQIIGRNCRFMQGPMTDRTVTDELALSVDQVNSNAACLINYRADGSQFLNLLAFRRLWEPRRRNFLIGCQLEFKLTQDHYCDDTNCDAVDRAWRQLRRRNRRIIADLGTNDMYRLDSISMRFESAFIRAQNTLIKRAADSTRQGALYGFAAAQNHKAIAARQCA